MEAISTVPEYLRRAAAARFISMSPAYLRKVAKLGQGPPFSKLGKSPVYRRSDLIDWVAARIEKAQ
jgi:hypothetical protein